LPMMPKEWPGILDAKEQASKKVVDQRIRVWRHRGQCQDERFVAIRPEDLVSLHLHPYRTICRNCVRMFKLHGMGYHRTPLGTSTAPYRDVWSVGLANTVARHHTERQTSMSWNTLDHQQVLPFAIFLSSHHRCYSGSLLMVVHSQLHLLEGALGQVIWSAVVKGSPSSRDRAHAATFRLLPLTSAGVPSGPRNVISIVNETSVILEWHPPRETGGRDDVVYNIVCKKCRADRRSCSHCNDNVDFVPRQLGLIDTRVVISNLWAHTLYTFEIQAVNGVTNKSPYPAQHVSIDITTNQAGSDPVVSEVDYLSIPDPTRFIFRLFIPHTRLTEYTVAGLEGSVCQVSRLYGCRRRTYITTFRNTTDPPVG
ncbi:hypothetical protein NFI96_020397, partial [Prochilodus magdalenae]